MTKKNAPPVRRLVRRMLDKEQSTYPLHRAQTLVLMFPHVQARLVTLLSFPVGLLMFASQGLC